MNVAAWLKEIDAAYKREDSWREAAKTYLEMYDAGEKASSYNILFANTAVLAPALYNSVPKPVVQERYQTKDPVAQAACDLISKALDYWMDRGLQNGLSFDELMEEVVLSALITGRGVVRFSYSATTEAVPADDDDDDEGSGEEPTLKTTSEGVEATLLGYDEIAFGFARKWEQIPWIAFRHHYTKQEVLEKFPDVTIEDFEPEKLAKSEEKVKYHCVWELWDKATKQVTFLSAALPEKILKQVEDPYKLSGFFPIVRFLGLIRSPNSLRPLPPYNTYKAQAEELEKISTRINKLIEALKVRGAYNSGLEAELSNILEQSDNKMVPVDMTSFANGGSFDQVLWFYPVEKLTSVLQQLYRQREECKQIIFEITGIADIMRGSTAASETLGAQQLKQKWGAVRLTRMQKAVERYARDCLRMMADMTFTCMSPQTIMEMCATNYPDEATNKLLLMQGQQQAPVTQEAVFGLLSSQLQRSFQVDVETLSTIEPDIAASREELSSAMNAVAQYISTAGPMVKEGVLPFEAFKVMLTSIAGKFQLTPELERTLRALQPPEQKESPEQSKEQMQMQILQMEMQMKQMEIEAKRQELAQKMELASLQHTIKMRELQAQSLLSGSLMPATSGGRTPA